MKNTILFATLILSSLLFATSCKKKSTATTTNNNNNTETIEVEVPITKTKTMPDSISNGPIAIPYPGLGLLKDTFATKVDEMLATYGPAGLTKDKIIKIEPMMFEAVIDNTTSQNFDFIDDSVYVYIDKYQGTNPIKVAYAKGIAKGSKQISFTVINTDLKDLFYNDYLEFNLQFGTPAYSVLKANSVFITSLKFKITAYKP